MDDNDVDPSHSVDDGKSDGASVRPFDPAQGMAMGVGLSGVFEVVRGQCMDVGPLESVSDGQRVEFEMKLLENHRDLAASLEISHASQVKAAFDEYSVDAKAKFAFGGGLTIDRYSVYLFVATRVLNGTERPDSITVKSDVAELLASGDDYSLSAFRLRCGDSFMMAQTLGGEYFGVIEIKTESNEAKAEVTSQLGAALALPGVGSGDVSQDFHAKLTRVTSGRNVRIWQLQNGGAGTDANPASSVQEMIARATSMPEILAREGHARPILATFQDYLATELSTSLPARYVAELSEARRFVDRLAALQMDLLDARANIDYAVSHPMEFDGLGATGVRKLETTRATIDTRLTELRRLAAACVADLAACQLPADLIVPTYTEPVRRDAPMTLGRDVSIRLSPRSIRTERIADYWSDPECYVQVRAGATRASATTVIRTTIQEGCHLSDSVLRIRRDRLESILGSTASRRLYVEIWEADRFDDDLIGVASMSYDALVRAGTHTTSISNEALLVDITADAL